MDDSFLPSSAAKAYRSHKKTKGKLNAHAATYAALSGRKEHVPSLQHLAAAKIIDEIERGFDIEGFNRRKCDGPMKSLGEVRGNCFHYATRKLLKKLSAAPHLARYVLEEMAPLSNAVYCAMVSVGVLETFDARNLASADSFTSRNIDNNVFECVSGGWAQLQRLNLRAARISAPILNSFASGAAAHTLKFLDLSGANVTDADVAPIRQFRALKELHLSHCQFITITTVSMIAKHLTSLTTLGLTMAGAPFAATVDVLAGKPEEDPLPNLEEIYMEAENWEANRPAMREFLQRRKHLEIIRVWSVIPSHDYSIALNKFPIMDQLLALMPLDRLVLLEEGLPLVKKAPYLTQLRLQLTTFDQGKADMIADACPQLRSLSLMSTKFSSEPGVDFGVFSSLSELHLMDARLGIIAGHCSSLTSLSMVIFSSFSKECTTTTIDAIRGLPELRVLNLMTSHSDLGVKSVAATGLPTLLESLPKLEDLVFDRDLFRHGTHGDPTTTVSIKHENLKSVKIISSDDDTEVPCVSSAPRLISFQSSSVTESICSLESICAGSKNLRQLKLRLQRESQQQDDEPDFYRLSLSATVSPVTTPPDTARISSISEPGTRYVGKRKHASDLAGFPHADPMRRALVKACQRLDRLHFLSELSIDGAAESLAARLPMCKFLHSLSFSNCHLASPLLARLTSSLPSLRNLELDHCSGFDSLDSIHGMKIARLKVRSCTDLFGDLRFSEDYFPNLEVIRVEQVSAVTAVIVRNLPELRSAIFRNIDAPSRIKVLGTPRLLDLALDNVSCTTISVKAPELRSLYVECGLAADDDPDARVNLKSSAHIYADSPRSDSRSVIMGPTYSLHFVTPKLERFWFEGEDVPVDTTLALAKKHPNLEVFQIPLINIEEIDEFTSMIAVSCPQLRSINCGDGDISLDSMD
eukprot:TRINITY_DN11665_c0_g1_i1.p1 TRINITY_DN11665_c0_g1~~TRINITY_DN11665_c0_g1_i1.p1  ORF type:complete len:923 (+),score=151.07 TRINITY_DN11665_c0_g1_i1:550-3318(+)